MAQTVPLPSGSPPNGTSLALLELRGLKLRDVTEITSRDRGATYAVTHSGGTAVFRVEDLPEQEREALFAASQRLFAMHAFSGQFVLNQEGKQVPIRTLSKVKKEAAPKVGKGPNDVQLVDNEPLVREIREAAENGDAEAMFQLGMRYRLGLKAPCNWTQSNHWLTKAAEAGHSVARGCLVIFEIGGKPDYARGFAALQKGVDEKMQVATPYLARCYEHGWGCKADPAIAFSLYQKAAESGDDMALLALGRAHYRGVGTRPDTAKALATWERVARPFSMLQVEMARAYLPKKGAGGNEAKAIGLLEAAASNRCAAAMVELGILYASKNDGQAFERLAWDWFKRANEVDPDDIDALIFLGSGYLDGFSGKRDATEAFRCFARAATLGDAFSMNWVGELAEKGEGIPRDVNRAFAAYQRAADAGNGNGIYNLGRCQREGIGTARSAVQAFQTWQRGAGLGDPLCMAALVDCYEQGKGVRRDVAEAARWCIKGAEQDHPLLIRMLAKRLLAGDGVVKDVPRAIKLFESAVEKGDTGAMVSLGLCYSGGIGVPRDKTRAADFFEQAAMEGNPNAMFRLGVCYQQGIGRPVSITDAVQWWREGAEANDGDCLNALGMAYRDGQGVPPDPKMAFEMVQRATKAGSPEAVCNLAQCYIMGVGVTPDTQRGLSILKEAGSQGNANANKLLQQYQAQIAAARNPTNLLEAILRAAFTEDELKEWARNVNTESYWEQQNEYLDDYKRMQSIEAENRMMATGSAHRY